MAANALRHAHADRADAAVKIKKNFTCTEIEHFLCLLIQKLGAVMVDLIKRGDGEPESEAPEGVIQIILTPEHVAVLAQNHVVIFRLNVDTD